MSTTSTADGICLASNQRGSANQSVNDSTRQQSSTQSWNGQGRTTGGGDMDRLARALGWFSLGLGLAQVAAPSKVAQLVGVDDDDNTVTMMRVVGAREIASGIGILTQPKPTPWLWSRVGGDAMDLALLSSAMSSPRADRHRVATATAAVLGIAAVDALCSTRLTSQPDASDQGTQQSGEVHANAAVTVNASIEEVYSFWKDFQNLPRFMSDFASVEVSGEGQSRWTLTAPAGISLDWDVEITHSTPNQLIAWRTAEGNRLNAEGEVRFRTAPGGRGTQVIFDSTFSPPGGELGKKIAGVFAEALGTKIGNDLRRFKQLIELGEIVHSDDSVTPGPNPAQPPATVPSGVAFSTNAA